jgi:hypothetical protein
MPVILEKHSKDRPDDKISGYPAIISPDARPHDIVSGRVAWTAVHDLAPTGSLPGPPTEWLSTQLLISRVEARDARHSTWEFMGESPAWASAPTQ